MKKACEQCRNLLDAVTHGEQLQFKCKPCNKVFPANPEDTLMASFTKYMEHDKYSDLIRGSAYDPTNKKINKKCKNCGKDYMSMLRLGEDELVVFVCTCEDKGSKLI